MSDKRLLTKYLLFFILSVLSIILIGQLIAQLFTINQLDKVTGKVTDKQIEITSFTRGTKYARGDPNHSLVVTLDNKRSYNVELTDYNWGISDLVNKGDHATIYNPTLTYNILSLDILGYGSQVSQFEINNQMLYSFASHKHNAWKFIGFLIIASLPFCFFLYQWYADKENFR